MGYIACLIAILTSYFCSLWLSRHAQKLDLVQAPNHRSSHVRPTPTGGGLGIIAGTVLAIGIFEHRDPRILGMLGLALLLALTGLRDDKKSLPASIRLLVQWLVCVGAVWLIPPPAISWLPQAVWLVLLVIAGIWWINLFNFMDGIDGIAGVQAIAMLVSACFISQATESAVWWCMVLLAAATFGFLLHNWPPAKIFMGDVGSTFLAFVIFALALMSIHQGWLGYAAWLILGAAFIVDSSVTLLRRMLAGERWFEAHRCHAYQHLARKWNSHKRVTLFITMINGIWLVPLASASMHFPSLNAIWLPVAYFPLLFGAIACGAGKKE